MTTPKAALEAMRVGKSYRELAAEFGMDHAYIYRVINNGEEPSDRLLELIGLERVVKVTYRKRRPQ